MHPVLGLVGDTGIGWEGIGVVATNGFFVLLLLWRISAWRTAVEDRLKVIETLVFGDGKGNDGCALRHRALDIKISDAATRVSMASAFDQIRELKEQASEDRRKTDVALERIEGILRALMEKLDHLSEIRALGRQKTNPGFDPNNL